jgi:glyoxylase-like metal-dependent hydrolase (beta-lactamase superfamily II)
LGEVGRPDLSVSSAVTKEDLAGMLYDSIQKIKLLDKTLRLYPGHGAGSTCGKTIGNGNFCNL